MEYDIVNIFYSFLKYMFINSYFKEDNSEILVTYKFSLNYF